MSRLDRKRILISAAAAGIGRAMALAFTKEGAHVIAIDIDEPGLSALKNDAPGIEATTLDVTDRKAIESIQHRYADIDVLCNVAGWVHHGSLLDCTPDDWDRSVSINMTAMYLLSRAVLPGMLKRGHGNIINMGSVASSVAGVANRFAYGATKAGVIGLTKAIAADFVGRGIRCNAICPGTVDTPSLQERMRAQGDYESARAAFVARQPMGRLGEPEEIAALATYLASDESAFTTGAIHIVDGGWTA